MAAGSDALKILIYAGGDELKIELALERVKNRRAVERCIDILKAKKRYCKNFGKRFEF